MVKKMLRIKVSLFFLLFCLISVLYANPRLDSIIGAYNGTYSEGKNGLEIMVFKNGDDYKAMVYMFPINSSSTQQESYSYLSNIRFDNTANLYDIIGSSRVNMPDNINFIDFFGTLNRQTLSGRASLRSSETTWSFTANKTTTPKNRYTGAHAHYDTDNSRITITATCNRAGNRAFSCVFCGTETRNQSIARLSHTPFGGWVVEKEASCLEEGSEIRYCRVCEGVAERRPIIGIHRPSGEWETVRLPNCVEVGARVQFCLDCNRVALEEPIATIPDAHPSLINTITRGSFLIPPIYRALKCEISDCNYVGSEELDIFATILSLLFYFIMISVIILIIISLNKKRKKAKEKNSLFMCPFCYEEYKKDALEYHCVICDEHITDKDLIKSNKCNKIKKICDKCGKENKAGGTKCDQTCNGILENIEGKLTCNVCGKMHTGTGKEHDICKNPCPGNIYDVPCNGRLIRKCPIQKCKEEIKSIMLSAPFLPFSIVGVTKSGKTHFITVMLETLKNSAVAISLDSETEATAIHHDKHKILLYDELVTLERTTKMETAQIWSINNLYRPQKSKKYIFTIYDGAGEDLSNSNELEIKYLKTSKALIIVVDPDEFKGWIQKEMSDPKSLNLRLQALAGEQRTETDNTKVSNNVFNFLTDLQEIKEGEGLNIPIAIVLTKFDMYFEKGEFKGNTVANNYRVAPISDKGKLDIKEIKRVSQEIQSWLVDQEENNFIQKIMGKYTNYMFFGVSSLGKTPTKDKKGEVKIEKYGFTYTEGLKIGETIEPHRVLDPLLWILHKAKFID